MRRHLLAALVAALLTAGSAAAIINGEPDGDRHPYVVALGITTPDGGRFVCSGTLVSSTVVVTAGHCTAPAAGPVVVWNAPEAAGQPPVSAGTAHTSPDFSPARTLPNTGDLGVVVLQQPVVLKRYARLPKLGYLDGKGAKKARKKGVTIVGYGIPTPFTRMQARTEITSLENEIVRGYGIETRGVSATTGGTCQGDSGGPVLLKDVVLGVDSFGEDDCSGPNYAYRTDTRSAQPFLAQFVDLEGGGRDGEDDD